VSPSAVEVAPPASSQSTDAPFKLSPTVLDALMNLDTLEATYLSSRQAKLDVAEVSLQLSAREETATKRMDVSQWSAYTSSQYGRSFPHSIVYHTALCCERQVKLLSRNLTMTVPRLFSAVLMGLIYGTLFYQLGLADFNSKLGLIQNAIMFVAVRHSAWEAEGEGRRLMRGAEGAQRGEGWLLTSPSLSAYLSAVL
jgi:hypothetical protein